MDDIIRRTLEAARDRLQGERDSLILNATYYEGYARDARASVETMNAELAALTAQLEELPA